MHTAHTPIPLVALRNTLGDVVNRVGFGHERATITKNGKPVAALIPIEDLELLDRLEEQADLEALRQARAQDDGTRIPLRDFIASLEG